MISSSHAIEKFAALEHAAQAVQHSNRRHRSSTFRVVLCGIAAMLVAVLAIAGCGSGGYPGGGGLTGISINKAVTIDSGQTFPITVTNPGNLPVTWTVTCSTPPCGTFSAAAGDSTGYTAPAGLTAPMSVTVTASIPGTNSSQTVTIAVNPDPKITPNLPVGVVGTPYSGSIIASGGTAPDIMSVTVSLLPPGLTYNAATGAITGTPTAAGTFTFTAQSVDSSAEPITITQTEKIVITTPVAPILPVAIGGLTGPGTVGVAYTGALTASGGVGPYTFSVASGTLPIGLTLAANGAITGTPTTPGTFTFTGQVKDSTGATAAGSFSITVAPATTLSLSAPPSGKQGTPYTGGIGVSGGTGPYNCTLTAGTLPAGLTFGANCALIGTPTQAGSFPITVKATDANGNTTTGTVTLVVAPTAAPLTVAGNPPAGMVGTPYSTTLTASGGTSPYTFAVAGGTLPGGLTLNAAGVLSGTPTNAGPFTFTAQVTDANGTTATNTFTVTVAAAATPPAMMLTLAPPASGTVGTPYSSSVGISGGTAPYTCTPVAGLLPAGLVYGANCAITGTPTVSGSFPITVTATDSANPANTTTGTVTLVIAPPATPLTVSGNPPTGTVGQPYTTTLMASGGTSPYAFSTTAGSLPPGLTLSTTGVVSGTPTTPGTYTFSAQVKDANGVTSSTPFTITINMAVTLQLSSPPAGTVGSPYMGTIGVSGGTGPYTCMVGALPAGLTASSNCTITGTPTMAGSYPVTVTATDSSMPQNTTTGMVTVTVNPTTPVSVMLTLSSPPSGTMGSPYMGSIGVSGGAGPYTCMVVGGTVPAGLTVGANCAITGTPTVSGTFPLTVKATDGNGNTTTGNVSLTVNPAGAALAVMGNPPAGTVGTTYSATLTASGGTGPYTFSTAAGNLPTGLSLSAGGVLSGTPSTAGTFTFTAQATDANGKTATNSFTVTVAAAPAMLTLSGPPAGSIFSPYTGSVGVTGGTGPYTCSLITGTLPTGLSFGANCAITGTPTVSGSFPLTVKATDAAGNTTTAAVTLTIAPLVTLTLTASLPNGVVGAAYTQTVAAQGGLAPYTYAVTAGSLPAGLTLSSTGVISGKPTAPGASSFTITATDAEGKPMTASAPLVILITYPATPQDAALTGPFAYLFQGYDDVTSGVFAYQTATVASFTADGKGAISAGEQDSNHQDAATNGATTANALFLGTYTLGADYRGSLTITTLNADGTTRRTTTYSIAVKAPVAPATITAQGSLMEADGDKTVGTKGSGTLYPQTAAAFTGSYAFGISGDAPCFLTCTANLAAGPVATVGQIVTNGSGNITGGTSDSNDATAVTANSLVSGSYGSEDANGRLKMSLVQSGVSPTVYPTNFAVYVINANQVFLLSTDSHSSYILQAGTATLQTQNFYSNASMNAAFVGYENSVTNPGLIGSTLQNTLNLSTATVFRAVGNGAGSCNVTSVDVGGTTALINNLTGLGGSATGLANLLGQTSQTGTTGCTVANNGRGVLQYPVPTVAGLPLFTAPAPRVFYLISPNNGYFLETSFAGLGRFEAQIGGLTGTPFSYSNTFKGTFDFGSVAASSLASTDDDGTLTTDGAGKYNGTQDLNTGVGTQNLLQIGITTTGTYTQPDATTGRFIATGGLVDGLVNGNLVIYAITNTRFAAVDTSATSTSPSITLLY